eukprot:2127164-Prymnesium_polylepis.1
MRLPAVRSQALHRRPAGACGTLRQSVPSMTAAARLRPLDISPEKCMGPRKVGEFMGGVVNESSCDAFDHAFVQRARWRS